MKEIKLGEGQYVIHAVLYKGKPAVVLEPSVEIHETGTPAPHKVKYFHPDSMVIMFQGRAGLDAFVKAVEATIKLF